jgi:tetratricopeptide (TPR) repeat protein
VLSLEQLGEEPEVAVEPSSRGTDDVTAAELMGQADVARASGRYAEAEQLLGRLLASFPGDSRAASAAFTRGVIQQQALSQPDAAIASFRQVLRVGGSTSLREDAYRRWFDILVSLRRTPEARSVQEQYARAFPNGQHLPKMLQGSSSGRKSGSVSTP